MKYFIIAIVLLITLKVCFSRSISTEKKYIVGAYNIFWCISLLISFFTFSGRYSVSVYAYFLVGLSIIMFNLGFFRLNVKRNNYDVFVYHMTNSVNSVIGSFIFNFIVLVLTLYLFSLFFMYIDALTMASASSLRTDFFDEDTNLYGSLFLVLNTWILKPFNLILLAIFPFALHRKMFFQSIVYLTFLVIYNSLGGGRFGYAQILFSIYFVLIFVLRFAKFNFSFRIFIFSIFFLISFYVIIAFTTALRMSNFDYMNIQYSEVIEETNNQLSAYASGPVAAFSYSLDKKYLDQMGGYQYGKLTFGSIDQIFDILFRKLGVNFERSIPKFAKIKQDKKIEIRDDLTSWNALYTSNLFFYLDYGIYGICLLPFFFAFLFAKSIRLLYTNPNVMSLILVNYLFLNCLHSVFDFRLYTMSELIYIVVLLMFATRKKYIIS